MTGLRDISVFITGAGAPGAPGIIKSLRHVRERRIRLVGGDASIQTSIGSGLLDDIFELPIAEDPTYIDQLLEICIDQRIDVLVPLVTRELPHLAENKARFRDHGITISVSDPEPLKTANNKYNLMSYCRKNSIPAPDFRLVNSTEQFIEALNELGYPGRKICFKPPVSNGQRGFRIINESPDRMQSLINDKPSSTFIGLNEFLEICRSSSYFPELLVMEYLPGEEYSVDVLTDNGRFISAIPRSRDHVKMGISFVGTAVYDPLIIDYSKRIVEGLCLNGNIGLQFKRDNDGIPKIIESNPRVQGTIVLCLAAGENMVYEAVKIALGEQVEQPSIKWGTRMIRYWEEIFLDANGKPVKI